MPNAKRRRERKAYLRKQIKDLSLFRASPFMQAYVAGEIVLLAMRWGFSVKRWRRRVERALRA